MKETAHYADNAIESGLAAEKAIVGEARGGDEKNGMYREAITALRPVLKERYGALSLPIANYRGNRLPQRRPENATHDVNEKTVQTYLTNLTRKHHKLKSTAKRPACRHFSIRPLSFLLRLSQESRKGACKHVCACVCVTM